MIVSKRNHIFYNVALWFLTSLFLIEVIYIGLCKVIKSKYILGLLILIGSIFAAVKLKTLSEPKWPWTLDSSLYYMMYFYMGDVVKRLEGSYKHKQYMIKVIASIGIMLNILMLVVPHKLQVIYTLPNPYINYIWGILIGASGIITYIIIAKRITSSRFISNLGKNSLIIFGLHIPLGIFVIDRICQLFNIVLPQSNIVGMIKTIVILVILRPVIKVTNDNFYKSL